MAKKDRDEAPPEMPEAPEEPAPMYSVTAADGGSFSVVLDGVTIEFVEGVATVTEGVVAHFQGTAHFRVIPL